MKAAANGQEAVIRTLLAAYLHEDRNARDYPVTDPVNIADKQGKTALMLAAAKGHVGTVEVLTTLKHRNGTSTAGGWRRLSWNVTTGFGAVQVDRRDNSGKTALEQARENGHTAVVNLLEKTK